MVNTSDELMDDQNVFESVITESEGAIPGTSSGHRGREMNLDRNPDLTCAEKVIKEAEASRTKILTSQGKDGLGMGCPLTSNLVNDFMHTALMDEDYLAIGGHVDITTQKKIVSNEYIDFARLLPCNRLAVEEDHCIEMINQGGMSYWVPVSDHETGGSISSFVKWEQAFRVYSNIYTSKFLSKASELIQYNHIIHTAALTYVWDNVYQYNKEFHLHMARHPKRSWAIILQQAWNLRLKDKIVHNNNFPAKNSKFKSHEACRRFNKGLCMKGLSCNYEHRCTVPECGKFGHGAHICRKKKGGGAMAQGSNNMIVNDLANNANHNNNNSIGRKNAPK